MYTAGDEQAILSGHRIWVGDRTSDPNGAHVRLLRPVINPKGIKIGPRTDSDRIARLVEALDISEPGSISFMIRIGREKPEKLAEVVGAIAKYAPNQLQQHDVHDDTEIGEYDGKPIKLRSVENTILNIEATHSALAAAGLRLHGLHIEAKGTNTNEECTDLRGQIPENINPVLDPLFTLRQWHKILSAARQYLPQTA
jgi:3-deoxy-7-phosphoheptulonate synthase